MEKFLKMFDLWGSNFNLLFKLNKTVYSWQGGLVSMIFIIISLIFGIFKIYNWVSYSYLFISLENNYVDNSFIQFGSASNYMMSFCLGTSSNSTDRPKELIDSFDMSFSWNDLSRIPWLVERPGISINLTKCHKNDFPPFISETYSYRLFENCTCANTLNMENFNISYYFTDTYSAYLSFSLSLKKSILANDTLFNKTINYLNQVSPRFFIYFSDSRANLNDKQFPFMNYINHYYSYINPEFTDNIDFFLSNMEVRTDDNYIGLGNYINNKRGKFIFRNYFE